jgi:hypothetical protein
MASNEITAWQKQHVPKSLLETNKKDAGGNPILKKNFAYFKSVEAPARTDSDWATYLDVSHQGEVRIN